MNVMFNENKKAIILYYVILFTIYNICIKQNCGFYNNKNTDSFLIIF